MESPNNTLIGYGHSITDSQGNVWTITANGQVAINGTVDPKTGNVTHLAYANRVVWQENTSDMWWSKSSPSAPWSPPTGTSTVPVPVTTSLNDTMITASNGSSASVLTDASGNTWGIVNGQVSINGKIDRTTSNVTHLAYVNGVVWQENINSMWWSKSTPAASWSPPAGTATPPLTIYASQNDTVLGAPSHTNGGALTDQAGNQWSIANGQVTVNGVADPNSANVIQLAYVNGAIWQENNQGLWWYTTSPTAGWSGGGIAASPIGTTFYVGNSPTDAATIYVGRITVVEPAAPPNSLAKIITPGFTGDGTIVGLSSSGTTIVVTGDSSLTNGATLQTVGYYRAPGPAYSTMENDGAMTISGSTAQIGALSGTGSITASQGSTLFIQNDTAGNSITLQSSHLTIGGQDGFGEGNGPAGGMSFLSPIAMDSASSITLSDTAATNMVLHETNGSISEVFLYNGSTEVADLKLHGVAMLYAETGSSGSMTFASTPNVTLQTTPTGHDLPSAFS